MPAQCATINATRPRGLSTGTLISMLPLPGSNARENRGNGRTRFRGASICVSQRLPALRSIAICDGSYCAALLPCRPAAT